MHHISNQRKKWDFGWEFMIYWAKYNQTIKYKPGFLLSETYFSRLLRPHSQTFSPCMQRGNKEHYSLAVNTNSSHQIICMTVISPCVSTFSFCYDFSQSYKSVFSKLYLPWAPLKFITCFFLLIKNNLVKVCKLK